MIPEELPAKNSSDIQMPDFSHLMVTALDQLPVAVEWLRFIRENDLPTNYATKKASNFAAG